MNEQYTIARGSEQMGPYTRAQIDEYLAAGSLQPTDLVWTEGMADWTPISQLSVASPLVSGPPAPDMTSPTAGSSGKAIITWFIRGATIFILLGVGGVYLFVDRPAKAEMMSAYEKAQKNMDKDMLLHELNEELGKEPDRVDRIKQDPDGIKRRKLGNREAEITEAPRGFMVPNKKATYTWKGVLGNYQIVILYREIDHAIGAISIVEVSIQ